MSELINSPEQQRRLFKHVIRQMREGIAPAEAERAACRMEHLLEPPVLERFLGFARFVDTCPHIGAEWVRGLGFTCNEKGAPDGAAHPRTGARPRRGRRESRHERGEPPKRGLS